MKVQKVEDVSLENIKEFLPVFYDKGFDMVEAFYAVIKHLKNTELENDTMEIFGEDIQFISDSGSFKEMERLFTTYAPVGKDNEFPQLNAAYAALYDVYSEMKTVARELAKYVRGTHEEGMDRKDLIFLRDTAENLSSVYDFLPMVEELFERYKPEYIMTVEEKNYGTPANNVLTKDFDDTVDTLTEVFLEYKPDYMDEDEFREEVEYSISKYIDYGLEEITDLLKKNINRWERNNRDRKDEYEDRESNVRDIRSEGDNDE